MPNNPALGLNTNFGFADEVTYGTRVAPTNFCNIVSESFKLNQSFNPITVLGKGDNEYYVNGKRHIDGAYDLHAVYDKTSAFAFKHALGNVVSSTVVSGLAYQHSITPSGALPVGFSAYVDRDSNQVGTAYAYVGCQISELKAAQELEQPLKLTVTIMGKDEIEVPYSGATITPPKYIEWDNFTWTLVTASGTVSGPQMHGFNVGIKNTLNENRTSLGSRLKTGQGRGGIWSIEGAMSLEFSDKSHYAMFRDNMAVSGNFAWTGQNISGTSTPYSLSIDLPKMILNGTTPNAGGEGEIMMELPFTAYLDSNAGYSIKTTFVNANSSI